MNLEDPRYWRLLVNQSFLRFYLLKALSQKAIHGYALQSALRVISNGLCDPSQGTIYPALNELEKNNYVKGTWKKVKNRRRKIYILTTKGRRALQTAEQVIENSLENLFEEKEKMPRLTRLPVKKKSKEDIAQLPIDL